MAMRDQADHCPVQNVSAMCDVWALQKSQPGRSVRHDHIDEPGTREIHHWRQKPIAQQVVGIGERDHGWRCHRHGTAFNIHVDADG